MKYHWMALTFIVAFAVVSVAGAAVDSMFQSLTLWEIQPWMKWPIIGGFLYGLIVMYLDNHYYHG